MLSDSKKFQVSDNYAVITKLKLQNDSCVVHSRDKHKKQNG